MCVYVLAQHIKRLCLESIAIKMLYAVFGVLKTVTEHGIHGHFDVDRHRNYDVYVYIRGSAPPRPSEKAIFFQSDLGVRCVSGNWTIYDIRGDGHVPFLFSKDSTVLHTV